MSKARKVRKAERTWTVTYMDTNGCEVVEEFDNQREYRFARMFEKGWYNSTTRWNAMWPGCLLVKGAKCRASNHKPKRRRGDR